MSARFLSWDFCPSVLAISRKVLQPRLPQMSESSGNVCYTGCCAAGWCIPETIYEKLGGHGRAAVTP